MDFNAWLVANGFTPEDVKPEQKPALQAAYRASQKPDDENEIPPAKKPNKLPVAQRIDDDAKGGGFQTVDAIAEAQRRENERRGNITTMLQEALKRHPSRVDDLQKLAQAALESDGQDGRPLVTVEKFKLLMLETGHGYATGIHIPSTPAVTSEVLEAAICKMSGLKSLEKEFGDQTLSAADLHYRGGIGLHELIGVCASARGFRGNVSRNLRQAMRIAFRPDDGDGPLALGPSVLDVAGILSNTANKFVKESWMFVESAWREITAVKSVKDFKQITSYSLTGDLTYKEVPAGGQLEHGTLGDESYTNQAKTYGIILGIDRRDMINDDLNAFSSVGRRLGRGGALKLNSVFWTSFLDNGSFFTSARGNYDDGTDTAFGNDGLVAADIIWQAMTDPDGHPMGHTAAILLVPPGHHIPAKRLMNSQQILATGEEGDKNPWAGMFKVVSSRYLANSSYAGYSALAWYMLADPNDIPVIETCFLNGQEMPTVETVELDSDRLGMAMRAYHDFGVTKQEYRGGLKLKGEA